MKLISTSTATTALVLAALAIGAPSTAAAADVSVVGAKDATPIMRGSGVDVKVATADILNRATGLVNKNTVATDNNVFVARSNVALAQNDRIALAKQVEQLVTMASSPSAATTASDMDKDANKANDNDMDTSKNMSTAVLTRNVLKAVSGKDSDAATMSKVSAVVAAKDMDASVRQQRIADLVNAVFDTKQQQQQQSEQTIQSAAPRGVIMIIGAKDILRQPTAAVNKNIAVTDTQVAVSRSTIAPSQNDNVALTGNAKVATIVAPASSIRVSTAAGMDTNMNTNMNAATTTAADNGVRMGFLFSKDMVKKAVQDSENAAAAATTGAPDAKAATEQLGLWGAGGLGLGFGFGWRYPLGYWNAFGAGLYGGIGGCGLGLAYGPYFYC